MSEDLADLFPGFEAHHVDTPAGRIFARAGGEGPPLLLLHGFPQTGVMWHRVAHALARTHRVVIADLPGYGWSAAPEPGRDHAPYSKRAMGAALVAMMEQLGHAHFALIGHDRGGRAAYRLALDHEGRVDRLALLDIAPTLSAWRSMDRARAMKSYHWTFLAQPHPFPETLIGGNPRFYLDWTLKAWSGADDLSLFDPRALAHYRAAFGSPDHIRGACEDYRAGATIDLAHDEADLAAGRTIACPVLVLWGARGSVSTGPLESWRAFAPKLAGQPIQAGHYLCEEAPDEVLAALKPFLAA
ncbi:alpha/beta fold hydrolase [Aquabacter spiritensis]|uniref:Haloacetate dehalogenase n=1 Tax=Aquabacter spiritensis TaxID=933073 RepID=A0A4R3LRK0_9HYPH|nr:alpha/beta hydrolase [Aquabacter spiritensis]TCT02931.1 haloacetate dehalogenase [Aquabacter spiritensis]